METKFKAFNTKTGEIIGPFFLKDIWCDGMDIEREGNNSSYFSSENYGKILYNFEDHIFLQYTGLKDKNEKEIYEGDIILKTWNNCKETVKWSNAGWIPFTEYDNEREFDFIRDNLKLCIVIGNIHENHELIIK